MISVTDTSATFETTHFSWFHLELSLQARDVAVAAGAALATAVVVGAAYTLMSARIRLQFHCRINWTNQLLRIVARRRDYGPDADENYNGDDWGLSQQHVHCYDTEDRSVPVLSGKLAILAIETP